MRTVKPLVLAIVLVLAASLPSVAVGHVKTDAGNWLFTGSTYKQKTNPPDPDNRTNPLNVIVRGPSGADLSTDNVKAIIEADWRDRDIPGEYPRGARMRPRTNRLCTENKYVFMRSGEAANTGTWKAPAAFMSTNTKCFNQYHLRMFSSKQHCLDFGPGHCTEWVVLQAHHEYIPAFRTCGVPGLPALPCPKFKHTLDQSPSLTRRIVGNALERRRCVFNQWAVHPESLGFNYPGIGGVYDGVIMRVSTTPKSNGCANA